MTLTFDLDDLDLEQTKFRQDRFSGSKVIAISVKCKNVTLKTSF